MQRPTPRHHALVVCVCLVGALPTQPSPAAAAEAAVFTSIAGAELRDILREEGYSADVNERGVVVWKIDGYRAQLFIDADDGSNMQFHASFSDGNATLKKVNEWNRTKRYSRTYIDDDGDPHLELDLDLEGGVTRERIIDFLTTCKVSFNTWCREVVE